MLDQGFREVLIKGKRHGLGLNNSWDLEEHRGRQLNAEFKQNAHLGEQHGTALFSDLAAMRKA